MVLIQRPSLVCDIILLLLTVGTSEGNYEHTEEQIVSLDPYTGYRLSARIADVKNDSVCYLEVTNHTANSFQNLLELYHPNFAYINLGFNISGKVDAEDDVILPYQWVWTYYSPDGFFPYLKWPVDFPILSLGMLDVKTMPYKEKVWLNFTMIGENCSLTIGEYNSTHKIAYALRDITEQYIEHQSSNSYRYSYWCYLKEVPGVKDTLAYQLGMYIGYPTQFVGYKCCRTFSPNYDQSKVEVECLDQVVSKMFQVTIIPYIIGLIAFALCPLFLLNVSEELISIGKYQRLTIQNSDDANQDDVDDNDHDWVFLDGNSPINITTLVGGLCGLVDKYPNAVSRFRRSLFVIFGPCIVLIECFIYNRNQHEITMAFLEREFPIGYLSIIGGFTKSKSGFAPVFGGPYLLLLCFYISGVIFVILPENLNSIIHSGSSKHSSMGHISPVFCNERTVESLSTVNLSNKYGYGRAAAVCKAGFSMLTNHRFWSHAIKIQYRRLPRMDASNRSIWTNILFRVLFILLMPVYVVICILELAICVLYYGVPIVSFIYMAIKGYMRTVLELLKHNGDTGLPKRSSARIRIFNSRVMRYTLTSIITCFLIYYIFSFCTIFTASFSFVAKILVFSVVAVIVYPNTFGYLFFGVALMYYIFKLLKSFGDGYSELLADAVEICLHMDDDLFQSQVFDGTVFIANTYGMDISKLQLNDRIINLSTDQRQQIKHIQPSYLQKIKHKNHTVGIPRDLFNLLVNTFLPVHIQVAQSLLWLGLVIAMLAVTLSIVVVRSFVPSEGISEVMHVLFIMIVGALPEVLGILMDKSDHTVKKEIKVKKIRATIQEYWVNRRHEADVFNDI